MRGLCTVAAGQEAQIMLSGSEFPEVGAYYYLTKEIPEGTDKQNKTLHPLLICFYNWMLRNDTYQFEENGIEYDFRCPDWKYLKEIFKMRYGAGADHYEYVNDKYQMVRISDIKELPDYVMEDFKGGNTGRIKGIPKSWSKYNKKQRTQLIDNLLNIMRSVGVDSKKFSEIQEGLEDET